MNPYIIKLLRCEKVIADVGRKDVSQEFSVIRLQMLHFLFFLCKPKTRDPNRKSRSPKTIIPQSDEEMISSVYPGLFRKLRILHHLSLFRSNYIIQHSVILPETEI
jgi:hypothetical protein